MKMNFHDDMLTLEMGESVKIRLPGRAGLVTITTHLATADGSPRMRVDVESDTDRYGPADDGLSYIVENGDPGPGVVFLTGTREEPEAERAPDMEAIEREVAYKRANGLLP